MRVPRGPPLVGGVMVESRVLKCAGADIRQTQGPVLPALLTGVMTADKWSHR